MNKLAYLDNALNENGDRLRGLVLTHKNRLMVGMTVATLGAGAAGAQTISASDKGSAAVQGLGFSDMIAAFGGGIRQLVTDNGTALMIIILPILGWYFIRNQLRGSV